MRETLKAIQVTHRSIIFLCLLFMLLVIWPGVLFGPRLETHLLHGLPDYIPVFGPSLLLVLLMANLLNLVKHLALIKLNDPQGLLPAYPWPALFANKLSEVLFVLSITLLPMNTIAFLVFFSGYSLSIKILTFILLGALVYLAADRIIARTTELRKFLHG